MTAGIRSLRSKLAHDESGLTLVEVLIAVFILSIGLLALASTAGVSMQSVRTSRDRQNATQLASAILERARSLEYKFVGLDTDEAGVTALPASLPTGPSGNEDIVRLADGAVPYRTVDGKLTATAYVTYTNAAETEKRVTVEVVWTDGGRTHSVEEQTLIAEAKRGLNVPSFLVSQPFEQTGVSGETICFDHTLTNTGEQDRYSWQLFGFDETPSTPPTLVNTNYQVRQVSEPGTSPDPTVQGFSVPAPADGQGWFAWARIADPSTGVLARMEDDNGDNRPDSPVTIPQLSSTTVSICYTAVDASGNPTTTDGEATFLPRIYSYNAPTVSTETQNNDITNTLEVVTGNTLLFLHFDTLATNRVYPMNDLAPDTTTIPDLDADGVPGMRIDAGDAADTVFWDYTFDQDATVSGTVLRFYVRIPPDAPVTEPNNPPPPNEVNLDVTFSNFTQGTVYGTAVATVTEDTPAAVGGEWVEVEVPLGTGTVANQDVVRVAVACNATSDDACHISFDNTSTPAALRATVN